MAIVITKPSSQIGITTNAAVYSMAPTFLPTASGLLVVIANASASILGSISGNGNTPWTLVKSQNTQAVGNSARIWEGNVPGSPTSVSINMDYTGDNASGCCAAAIQITGQEVGVAPRQSVSVSSVGNNPVVTFSPAVNSGNAVVAGIILSSALAPVTAPAGWTMITASYGTPTTGLVLAYANGVSGTTFTFSTGVLAGLGYVAAEYYLAGTVPGARNAVPLLAQSLWGVD